MLLEADLGDGVTTTVAGFENHAGRTLLDPGATPLGRVVAGHGNDGDSGFEGCRVGAAIGTYLHGPLLPRNPELADWLLARALEHGGGSGELEPLADELERLAHAVSTGRARSRGGDAERARASRRAGARSALELGVREARAREVLARRRPRVAQPGEHARASSRAATVETRRRMLSSSSSRAASNHGVESASTPGPLAA